MAHSTVTLNTATFTEVSAANGANVHLPELGQRHRSPPDMVLFCVAASAAACTDKLSVPIVGFTINDWLASGIPVGSGEKVYAKWVHPRRPRRR